MQIAPINRGSTCTTRPRDERARRSRSTPASRSRRQEALRLYTAGTVVPRREERTARIIEVGQLGDVAVLTDDYFTVPVGPT